MSVAKSKGAENTLDWEATTDDYVYTRRSQQHAFSSRPLLPPALSFLSFFLSLHSLPSNPSLPNIKKIVQIRLLLRQLLNQNCNQSDWSVPVNVHSTEVIPTHHNTLVDLADLVHGMDDSSQGQGHKICGGMCLTMFSTLSHIQFCVVRKSTRCTSCTTTSGSKVSHTPGNIDCSLARNFNNKSHCKNHNLQLQYQKPLATSA